jgi:CHAT domain-containing protein
MKEAVKNVVSPKVLHIASHGFFRDRSDRASGEGGTGGFGAGAGKGYLSIDIQDPHLRAGLALSGANRTLSGQPILSPEVGDGILTAEDMAQMNLAGTELVVLSACETALGEVFAGEGVFGLQRAVATAGAKTLVMSLWKVPDAATCELMVDFYRRLLAGAPRGAALREAQRGLMARYGSPYYWGAFICAGNPAAIRFG